MAHVRPLNYQHSKSDHVFGPQPQRPIYQPDRESSIRVADDGILRLVPIIAVFFGIVIRMFYKEHEPAHFHAEHQGRNAKFDFNGKMSVGNIQSKTALRLIREWAILHRAELETNWANMKAGKPLDRIPPLE